MSARLKVVTIVGTRPEIIRLSRVIALLERHTDHILVHTGQNYDYELNEIFFEDLGLRRPDHFLHADTTSLGSMLGDVIRGTELVLAAEKPDAALVLGDTNSSIAAIIARRMGVPVYHMEAGNRSYDPNVPEEINRHLVDHVSDYNLVYTEHSRRNLLAEGIHPSRITVTGSPMREVLNSYADQIRRSDAVGRLGLADEKYFVASLHREENVDHRGRLVKLISSLEAVAKEYDMPVLMSVHPRTRKRLSQADITLSDRLIMQSPLGFSDYVALQTRAKCVLSDSGTISEESTILGFPAVTLRDAIERPEAVDVGGIIVTGTEPDDVLDCVRLAISFWDAHGKKEVPADYQIVNTSWRTLNFIRSTAATHFSRTGLRK